MNQKPLIELSNGFQHMPQLHRGSLMLETLLNTTSRGIVDKDERGICAKDIGEGINQRNCYEGAWFSIAHAFSKLVCDFT